MRYIIGVLATALLLLASGAHAQAVIVPSPVPACSNGDTLVWNTATTNFLCTTGAAASQPLTDAVGLIKNAANGTKILAFDVAGISSATMRTWTIPDANITVPSTIASLAANTFTALQTANGGVSSTTGAFSSTLTLSGSAANIALGSNYLSGDGGDEGIFVDSVGNVGIGTTSPTRRFYVALGDVGMDANYTMRWGGSGGAEFYGDTSNNWIVSTGNAERMRVLGSNGNVGIGTTGPSAQLHTTGTVRFANFGAGTATFDASGNISSASDERLKDIQGPFRAGLSALLGLRPILYRYAEVSGLDIENVYAGFSAQNVLGYIPEAIGKSLDGFYSLNIVPVVAATVTAVQELTREVDELRAALKLPARTRTVAPLVGDARVVTSATPTRLAEVAKQAEEDAARAKASADADTTEKVR